MAPFLRAMTSPEEYDHQNGPMIIDKAALGYQFLTALHTLLVRQIKGIVLWCVILFLY